MRTQLRIVGAVGVLVVTTAISASAAIVSAPVKAEPASINGQIAFYSSRDGTDNIYVMNADGTGQTRLTAAAGQHGAPAWSPDGTRIAFHSSRDDAAGATTEIYVMDADGTDQTRLTNNTASDAWAAWSPDGTQIVFTSNRDGNWEIYVMDADGSDQTRLTSNTVTEDYPAWSPDGTKIAFASPRGGDFEIYVMDADGTDQVPVTVNSANDTSPAWSPDGSRIAFASNGYDYDFEIVVMNADGTNQTRLTTTFRSTYPAWSPDGSKIAFMTFPLSLNNWEIFVMNSDGTDPVNVTSIAGGDFGPDWGVVPTPDETAPAVAIMTPADGAVYTLGSPVIVDYSCVDEPDGSGLASCVGDLPDGSLLDTSAVGAGSFTVVGADLAGNSAAVTHAYSVVWDFDGFFTPVDNPPVVNTVKAGRAIPVKFSLSGDQGLDIFGATPGSRLVACDGFAVADPIEETVDAGSSSLSYDATADQYTFVWKTSKNWPSTCRQLVLTLADGTEHVANFRF